MVRASKQQLLATKTRPVAVDLFAGAGGFSLGIEKAGFDVLVAVEHDPIHACTYAFNFPLTRVLAADVSKISGDDIREAATRAYRSHYPQANQSWDGRIDLVFGGPPCQGFSIMGKRSLDDERNNLVFHFHRLVTELSPSYFLMENVPGMAIGQYKLWCAQLKTQFEQAGYQVEVQILNAADFGVPQRRRRLFFLGSQQKVTPVSLPNPNKTFVTVKEAIADLPEVEEFPELLWTDEVLLSDRHLLELQQKASDYAKLLRGEIASTDFSYRRAWNPQLLTSSMRTQHTANSIERFASMLPNQREPISHLRRLDLNGLSHTLRAGTGAERGSYTSPRPIHPTRSRVISVREAARLHSFPDWFRFHQTKWHGFRQVGNAVPPLLAQALGRQAIAALEMTPSIPAMSLNLGSTQLLRFRTTEATSYWNLGCE
ncbi:DNA cytosine methyltransferase [Chroogloeocystis siderophila]|jgi:DNA (cytosine-5)-methyltransferase 1|uniref:Cytosine-specific methyltransferase n=1 Tax=Chroogloeocystis siderophila 5.2 s.c.1 TaxID=247279 RepID=A0A1U7HVX0_9CHRO|nr:DNA cytosine methyltransferase [Chroogloeocystis siderophila]OKH27735.1 DNA (cytosine-5-)-methyltransferase [Chroogloeocystis siderophila 5.2 s.c.1]